MNDPRIDISHLIPSPEIDSLAEWVPKVLAAGGLIIAERDCELIVKAKPHHQFADKPPELPPVPVSADRAAYLLCESPLLREELELVLADLNHTNRHSHIRKDILVRMIDPNRKIGCLKVPHGWYVLRTWDRRGYPPPHPRTEHTLGPSRTRRERTAARRRRLALAATQGSTEADEPDDTV